MNISINNMSEIWQQYKRLAFSFAKPFMKIYPEQADDIEQECFLAMVDAVGHYDPDKGSFPSCLSLYVQKRVGQYCRRNGCAFSISEHQFENERRLQRAGCGSVAGLSEKQMQNLSAAKAARFSYNFSDPVKNADGLTIEDTIPDNNDGIGAALDRIAMQELRRNLDGLFSCVSDTDGEYIKQHYYRGETYADIGKMQGKKTSYIASHVHAGLEKMRRKAQRSRAFDEYLDNRTRSKALRGGLASFNTSWTSSTECAAFDRIEREIRVNACKYV